MMFGLNPIDFLLIAALAVTGAAIWIRRSDANKAKAVSVLVPSVENLLEQLGSALPTKAGLSDQALTLVNQARAVEEHAAVTLLTSRGYTVAKST